MCVNRVKLTKLPEDIDKLTELEYLYATDNLFTELPDSITTLSKLKVLSLPYNSILALPENIGDLNSLETFQIHENKLTELPESIKNLSSLVELILMENQITTTLDMSLMTKMKRLDIGYNEMTKIPIGIENIEDKSAVDYFFLDYNHIKDLPKEVYGSFTGFLESNLGVAGYQTYSGSISGFGTINKDYQFTAIPVYEQVPTYGDCSYVVYELTKPDNQKVLITPVVANGKITIDKANLDQVGDYVLKGTS